MSTHKITPCYEINRTFSCLETSMIVSGFDSILVFLMIGNIKIKIFKEEGELE